MAQNAEDKAKAAAIVAGWTWQPAEGHNYRYRYATRTLTRFYEAASMQPDEVKLVVEYLRDQEIAAGDGISLLNRTVDFGEGWKAKDAWYQTTPGEKFANTDSTKIRVYQILFQAPEDKSGDGPYIVENGCAYKSTHTFYWDVEELPTLPASSSGVEYAMKGVTRDGETGLFSCVVEKRERVQQDVADYVTQETVFEKRSEEQHIGVKADKVSSTGKAASVADGKIVTRKITKNADCTSDVANTTEVEKGVKSSVVTVRKTLRGTVKTTLDRNQATAAETTGLSVGDEVRVEKTPGGLYNNTKSGVTAEAAGEIADSCQTTIFEHTHEKLENVATEPSDKEATAAGEGKTYSKTSRKTDEGSWDVTERTTEEKGVADSVVTVRKTLRGTVKTTLDRNQATAAETTGLSVGDEVRVEKTPGGLYNNTKSGVTAEAAGEIVKSCEDSGAVVHTDVVTKNETSAADITHDTASVNVIKRVTSRRTEEGTYDNETRTTTYKPATTTATTTWPLEKIVTTVVHHDTELNPEAKQGTASATPDDNGAATTTISEYTPTAFETEWITWESTTKAPSGTSTYKHGIKIFANLSKTELEKIKPSGSDVSISAHVNKYGLLDGAISYSDLTSWVRDSGSSSSGGSKEGSATFYQYKTDALGRLWQRTATVSTIAYVGSGNEGSEASSRANIKLVSGMSLPYRTYAKSAPIFGKWEKI